MTKVLLVEDHEELWDMLSRRLRRHGLEVVLAHDGQAALDQVAAARPEVVLLDMDLPVMDGWTVARTLRAAPATARLPVIAMTAHAMAGDERRALDAGCDLYHPKPVDLRKLLEQIDQLLLQREEEG